MSAVQRRHGWGMLPLIEPDCMMSCLYSHACYLVELPTPPGAARGVRIIFDPVFSNRCSPSRALGPARYTGNNLHTTYRALLGFTSLSSDTPCKIEDVPAVDAIVLSVFSPSRSLLQQS